MSQLDSENVGKRQTSQRDAIVAVIDVSNGPLTVQEIHERATDALPSLGIATVYRNMKLLVDAHQVHAVILPDGQTRYESANLGHHDHFRCRQCDQVFDLPQCPMKLPDGGELAGGFIVQDHELTLYGLCPSCVKKGGSKAVKGNPKQKHKSNPRKKKSKS